MSLHDNRGPPLVVAVPCYSILSTRLVQDISEFRRDGLESLLLLPVLRSVGFGASDTSKRLVGRFI